MSDEEASCLVRPRSPSSSAVLYNCHGTMPYTDGNPQPPPQQQQQPQSVSHHHHHHQQQNDISDGNNGGGGGVTDVTMSHNLDEISVLSQFHLDAIKQAGCGKFQVMAALLTGLGLSGHAVQVYSIAYVLPSAEVELCIKENEKSWLVLITLLGLAIGSLFWGGFARRAGLRKCILSCLAINTVFSVIAAFMPTYGPFMMTRFCASAAIGGMLAIGISYLCEITPQQSRSHILGIFGAMGLLGGVGAILLAWPVIPSSGQMVMIENKEHFSPWHLYLLFATLPTLAAVIAVIFWLPESPTFLLEHGREVEALTIYQKIYKTNRPKGAYSLTEVELPAMQNHRNISPPSVLSGMMDSGKSFFLGYVHIFRKHYYRHTTTLMVTWFISLMLLHGLTLYVTEYARALKTAESDRQTTLKFNETFVNENFNTSLDNNKFYECQFINCTFRRIFISHTTFKDCNFVQTEFTKVHTSRTQFINSNFETVKFTDTDFVMEGQHFVDCRFSNVAWPGLAETCVQDFEFNIYMVDQWQLHLTCLIPALFAVLITSEAVQKFRRFPFAPLCYGSAIGCCILFAFTQDLGRLNYVIGSLWTLIIAGLIASTWLALDRLSMTVHCAAFGLYSTCGHLGALIGVIICPDLKTHDDEGVETTKFAVASLTGLLLIVPTVLLSCLAKQRLY